MFVHVCVALVLSVRSDSFLIAAMAKTCGLMFFSCELRNHTIVGVFLCLAIAAVDDLPPPTLNASSKSSSGSSSRLFVLFFDHNLLCGGMTLALSATAAAFLPPMPQNTLGTRGWTLR